MERFRSNPAYQTVTAVAVLVAASLFGAGVDGAAAQRSPGIQILADTTASDTSGTTTIRLRVTDEGNRDHEIQISVSDDGSAGIVRFGEGITVNAGEFVDGDVVAIGGSIKNYGRVGGDCVAIGGNITHGEGASVDGNTVCLGGRLTLEDGTRIGGDAVTIWGSIRRAATAEIAGQEVEVGGGPVFGGKLPPFFGGGAAGDFWSLFRQIVWAATLLGLGVLLFVLFPTRMERVSGTVEISSLKAFFAGLAGWILYLPVFLALVITIIGIPVALLLLLLTPVLLMIAYAGTADALGRRLGGRFTGRVVPGRNAVLIGVLLLQAAPLLARVFGLVGSVFEILAFVLNFLAAAVAFVAVTCGFGALLISRFRPAQPEYLASPPPPPPYPVDAPVFGPAPGSGPPPPGASGSGGERPPDRGY